MIIGHIEQFHGVIVSPDEERSVLHSLGPCKTKDEAVQAAKDYINGIERRDYFVANGPEVDVFTARHEHCATIIASKW